MASGRRGRAGPKGPGAGSILTGTIVGQAKRGVMVDIGSIEIVLPRSKFGAAADRIEGSGYGDALTVEVVADPSGPGGVGLTRVGIERSLRQPRPIDGRLERRGSGCVLTPSDGSPSFPVVVLDRSDLDAIAGGAATWLVGAPHRNVRFVTHAAPGAMGTLHSHACGRIE